LAASPQPEESKDTIDLLAPQALLNMPAQSSKQPTLATPLLRNKEVSDTDLAKLTPVSRSFMRFDKQNSSAGLEMSESGLTITSTDKSQKAVCNLPMREGIHYWELTCPVKLSGISFGITNKLATNKP